MTSHQKLTLLWTRRFVIAITLLSQSHRTMRPFLVIATVADNSHSTLPVRQGHCQLNICIALIYRVTSLNWITFQNVSCAHYTFKSLNTLTPCNYLGNVEKISGFSTKITQRIDSIAQQPQSVVTSPFFPSLYPRDITKEHLITCNDPKLNHTSGPCRIRVIFTDFQVAIVSTMEVHVIFLNDLKH